VAIDVDLNDLLPWGRISPGMRDALLEAARVMLDVYHAHAPTAGTWISESGTQDTQVHWTPATQQMKSTHGNAKDATEDGAYALAVHAAHELGLQVLGRMPQGSGADWYVVDPTQPQTLMKLEVSGIAQEGSPGYRLNQKLEQAQTGTIVANGLAVVFRFADASLYSRRW
jgi:hypothetical protein